MEDIVNIQTAFTVGTEPILDCKPEQSEEEMQPYRLENLSEKIDTALKAKNGDLWSQQRAITFVGNVDNVLEEVEQIKEEQAEKQQNEISKQEQLSKFNSRNTGK